MTNFICKLFSEGMIFLLGLLGILKAFFAKEALVAAATALFIAGGGGRWLLSLVYKPKLKIMGYQPFRQVGYLKVWRMAIKNVGNEVAEDVQATTLKVFDDGEERRNFLPVPLRWTHFNQNQMKRDILPGQTVFLDIFEDIPSPQDSADTANHTIRLASEFGAEIKDFNHLYPNTTKFEIAILHRRMKPLKVTFFPRISLTDRSSIASMDSRMEKI
ncbi:MAG: hypothetical protein KIH67_000245 [Candidatus Moranbacteria bacterium]|nr:hypothetical protein [Candidatus Moranbacteria bacterium]